MSTEPKFKAGEKVWNIRDGLVELSSNEDPCYPVKLFLVGTFTSDGRAHIKDKFPSLYTLDEARAMGFPVPKEKMKLEVKVEWKRGHGVCFPEPISGPLVNWAAVEGKRGKMVFEEE